MTTITHGGVRRTSALIKASAERERKVLELWNQGAESAEIVKQLRLTSRNVVIGIVTRARARGGYVLDRREKLALSKSPTKQAISGAGITTAKNGIGGFVAPRFPASTGCQYPHGEPGTKEFRFCGAPRAPHRYPYCAAHVAACTDSKATREAWERAMAADVRARA